MRVVREISHPECKITVFWWNNRYIIKLEAGLFEQTYKINAFDIDAEEDLSRLIDETFIQESLKRFEGMGISLYEAMGRVLR